MSQRRSPSLLLLAAAVAVASSTPAFAAAQRSCRLVTDPRGDAHDVAPVAGPQERADLDVVSADVANDAARLTVVFRVASLRPPSPSVAGVNFALYLAVRESSYIVEAYRGLDGERFTVYGGEPQGVGPVSLDKQTDASGVFDTRRNEVRVSAPLVRFSDSGPVTSDYYLFISAVDTWSYQGARNVAGTGMGAYTGHTVDRTGPGRRYRAFGSSCVTVGA
ncbi:MAG: hypothetical protein ABR520_00405 [Mycobacteriales bacterium]